MRKLHIAPDLALPPEAVTQTFAILAKRRVGKTYTASVMAEEMIEAKLPFVVVDPTGAWWGLRASADGKSAGYPVVIIGGAHGDLPLEPTAGKVIADLVADRPGWYVLDLSWCETNADQDRFATDFALRLYRRKLKAPSPLHLFVDEADSFIPQRPQKGQERMLGAFEALIRRGGIAGIGMTMISQRASVINKNVLTQAEVLVALQIVGVQDRAAIEEWVKAKGSKEERDELMASLASLGRGEAWVWSPAWLDVFRKIHVRERRTFNSSATPEVGQEAAEPQVLAPVDLESLRGQIAATIEKAKAEDPKELQRRIKELEREVAAKNRAHAVTPAPQVIDRPVIDEAALDRVVAEVTASHAAAIEQARMTLRNRIGQAEREAREALDVIRQEVEALASTLALPSDGQVVSRAAIQRATRPLAARAGSSGANGRARQSVAAAAAAPDPGDDGTLSTPKRATLDAVAQLVALGIERPSVVQVALLRGVSHTTGTFKQDIRELIAAGYLEREAGLLALTPRGRGVARAPAGLRSLEELQEHWYATLPAPRAGILREVASVYPRAIARPDLAARLGKSHTTGTFKDDLRKLRDYGLVAFANGAVAATSTFFPEGVR